MIHTGTCAVSNPEVGAAGVERNEELLLRSAQSQVANIYMVVVIAERLRRRGLAATRSQALLNITHCSIHVLRALFW